MVLRRITGDGVEINQEVGEGYTIISKKLNPKQFEDCHQKFFDNPPIPEKDSFGTEDDAAQVFAFIFGDLKLIHGQPLYHRQENYMLSDGGRTYSNLNKHY